MNNQLNRCIGRSSLSQIDFRELRVVCHKRYRKRDIKRAMRRTQRRLSKVLEAEQG